VDRVPQSLLLDIRQATMVEFGSGCRQYRNQKGYVVAVLSCISEHITGITACQYATPAREPIWFRVLPISEPNGAHRADIPMRTVVLSTIDVAPRTDHIGAESV
jgi:hypothetical protein